MSTAPKYRMRPWLKGLLGLSLALNIAIAGLALGAAWRFKDFAPPHKGGLGHLGRIIMDEMDPDTRHRLRQERRADLQGLRGGRQQVLTQVVALLRAEPFDPEALRALLDAQAVQRQDFVLLNHAQWVEHLS